MEMMQPHDAHRISQIIKYLLVGGEVVIDGVCYIIETDESEIANDLHLFSQARLYMSRNSEPFVASDDTYWVRHNITLTSFLNLISKISDEQWTNVWSSLTLQALHGKKR